MFKTLCFIHKLYPICVKIHHSYQVLQIIFNKDYIWSHKIALKRFTLIIIILLYTLHVKMYSQLARLCPQQMCSHHLTMTHYIPRKTQRKALLQLKAKRAFQLEMMFYTWLPPWTKRRGCTLRESWWWVYVCCACLQYIYSNVCKLNALVHNHFIFGAIQNVSIDHPYHLSLGM